MRIKRPTVSKLFILAAIAILLTGGSITIVYANSALNVYVNDTLCAITFLKLVGTVALALSFFSAFYFLFSRSYNQRLNNFLGYMHFSMTAICAFCVLIPVHFYGYAYAPRRYYSNEAPGIIEDYTSLNPFLINILIVSSIVQVTFVLNLLLALMQGKTKNKKKS